eukprot:851570-Pyramimonas_sp.AAC.1
MSKRLKGADGGAAPKRAPRVGKPKARASGSDAGMCQRCDEPVDKTECTRHVSGSRVKSVMIGRDGCWKTFERHYAEDLAWPDVCEKCHEEPEFNEDFEKRAEADQQLEDNLSQALGEKGSVLVDTYYGQEIAKTTIQLTPQQFTSLIAPRGAVGLTPLMI